MARDRERIRAGEAPLPSAREVTELPPAFRKWETANADRLAQAARRGTLPHWLTDNFVVRPSGRLSFRPPAKVRQIQRNWLKRNRKRCTEEARAALLGTTAYHPEVGVIHFTAEGIKEAINQPHKQYYYKNRAVPHIKRLIEENAGSPVWQASDKKGRDATFHYISTEIEGTPSFIVLKETGRGVAFYSITEKRR